MKDKNSNRFTADSFENNVLLCDVHCRTQLGGVFAKAVDFVNRYQIKDAVLWNMFVRQFATNADDWNLGWRSEYWGKMMRGAAYVYAYTHDEELYEILAQTVRELLATRDQWGRITTYSVEQEFQAWDVWGRKYVLLGLQYFSEVCEDETLLAQIDDAMCAQLDYIMEKLGPGEGQLPISQSSKAWLGANSCSILEPVVRLYCRTGERKYLDYAAYIVEAASGAEGSLRIFAEAEEDTKIPSEYCERKAYETMSCFEGLIEYYRVTGEEKYRRIVLNFARRVMENEISIIGSCGCTHELFDNTRLHQVDPAFDGIMQETCVSVTWMKLCGQLLRLTGDAVYADQIEKTFFNAFYGAFNTHHIETLRTSPELGKSFREVLPFDSYSALRPGTRGRQAGGTQFLLEDGRLYGCCACISPIGIGFLPPLCAMSAQDGIALNFYFNGEIIMPLPQCEGKQVRFLVETAYPYDGKVTVTVEPDETAEFVLSVRIPAWSDETCLSVNQQQMEAQKGYTAIRRRWQKGDQITMVFDMRVTRIDPPADSPYVNDYVGLRRGCIVLAADARLGRDVEMPVDIAFDMEGHVAEDELVKEAIPDCELCLSVPLTGGGRLPLIDYASAGKTWNEESRYAAWLPRDKSGIL